jgi:hypothetical protein
MTTFSKIGQKSGFSGLPYIPPPKPPLLKIDIF